VVEPGCGGVRDEELRAVGIRAGVGHRENAGAVVLEVFVEFVFEGVAGAAGAGAFGATALDHKVGDHAGPFQTVVKAFAGKLLEIGDRLGRFIVEQLDADVSSVCFDRGYFHVRTAPTIIDCPRGQLGSIAPSRASGKGRRGRGNTAKTAVTAG